MRGLPFSVRHAAASLRRRPRLVQDEQGFSLIETVMAMVVMAIISVALIGLLESAIAANGLGRQRTVAQQLAQDQVEWIRQLDYTTEIGIPGGNPNGVIPATKAISVRGVQATMTTDVDWVNDPTPSSYSSVANYKRVTVVIRSNRNNAVLTTIVTYVAPPGRAPFGGLNNAIINVTVSDMGLTTNNALAGALVNLTTGPSAPLSDTTDSTGLVTFPGLTANPTTGPQAFYDLAASKAGYITYVADRSPNTPAHLQVAPSETASRTIRLYKPATINVALTNSSGSTYVGPTTVKVTSPLLSMTQTFSTSTGSLAVPNFAGDPVVPGDFTIRAFTPTGLCADPQLRYVPDNYPTVMTSTFTLQLLPCPSGTLVVNATQLGAAAAGAAITVSGGPNDFAPITQTANGSGQTTFTNLTSGSDAYTISVTDAPGNVTATGSAVIATGATTTANINLNDPPMGSISALVQWIGKNVSGATVTVTGGPYNVTRTAPLTGGSGVASFSNNIPAGAGYTITATKNGQTKIVTGVNVTAGSTTSQTLAMPTSTITVSATWAGQSIGTGSANNVSITGGPDSANGPYTGTTNASGQAVVTVPQSTVAYSVFVSKNGGSGTQAVATVPLAGASVAVPFTQTGTIRVTTTWAGAASSGASISITGGPMSGTYTGTTDAAGIASVIVPTSATAYAVSASQTGVNVSGSVPSVATGSTNNISLSFTVTFTINVKQSLTNQTTAIVKITGGPVATTNIIVTGNNTAGRGASGNYTMSNVPVGAGYTIKAYGSPCAATTPKSKTSTAVTIATGQGTINLVYDNATCPLP